MVVVVVVVVVIVIVVALQLLVQQEFCGSLPGHIFVATSGSKNLWPGKLVEACRSTVLNHLSLACLFLNHASPVNICWNHVYLACLL